MHKQYCNMIRAIISGIASLIVPGAGHMFINIQPTRGILIFSIFMAVNIFMLFFSLIGIGFLLSPVLFAIPLGASYLAYKDARKKKTNKH